MIVLTNSAAQTLAVGQSATFDTTVVHTGDNECHRKNSGSVKLIGPGKYEIAFSANVSAEAATSTVSLAIQLGGETLPETVMTSTTVAATDFNNVSTVTGVVSCCVDYNRVTVTNTGTIPVTIAANPSLMIHIV